MLSDELTLHRAVLAKIRRRLIPFMFVLYIVSYLDRINVGFAALQMNEALHFSSAVFGLGSGIFFIGYFLFEVPSNLILQRVGARLWIARIMITWGIISSAMMFVIGPRSFYLLRFLLGLAEAGFFPGMILYLTYWFPAVERARAVALFMTATAIAGVVGGPVSGALLEMHGFGGLDGWQWLFLLEGLPAVLLGLVVLRYLDDGPATATWLTPEERAWVIGRLKSEQSEKERREHYTLWQALSNGRVWLLALVYFCIIVGFYGVSFWLPQMIKGFSGLGNVMVGVVSAIPYVAAAFVMVLVAAHSDRTGERRWHVTLPALAGAGGLLLSGYSTVPLASLASFCIATAGIWGALGPFWTLPTAFLSGSAAAGGIALINSIGNLGGFVGPSLVGLVKTATQSFRGGLVMLSLIVAVGGLLTLLIRRESHSPESPLAAHSALPM